MNRVTLKDIASQIGLSVNAVSRALLDKEDISSETKNKVKRAAYELGYIKNHNASTLRSGVTLTIAVLYNSLVNPYYSVVTSNIHKVLKKDNYQLMIFQSESDLFETDVYLDIVSRRVDGIITFLRPSIETAIQTNNNKTPVVLVGREGEDLGVDSVYTDDKKGARLVAEYMYEKGHRKVGYVGYTKDLKNDYLRSSSFKEYYQSKGIDISDDVMFINGFGVESYYAHINKSQLTAVFCFNDMLAHQLMKEYDHKLLIIGFDNIDEHIGYEKRFMSVDSDKKLLAELAVSFLKGRIRDTNKAVESRVLEVALA